MRPRLNLKLVYSLTVISKSTGNTPVVPEFGDGYKDVYVDIYSISKVNLSVDRRSYSAIFQI